MRSSSEYRARARAALVGRWGICIAVTLVAALLGAEAIPALSVKIDFEDMQSAFKDGSLNIAWFIARLGLEGMYYAWFSWVATVFGMLSLVQFILGGAVELGHDCYYMELMRGEEPEFNKLFSRFEIFGKALGMRLFMGLFIFLWGLLFVIPGIVASYRYRMAPFLMAQDPGLGIREAVDMSKRMTMGHKGEWFVLDLTFIGWHILCGLSLGIGYLWLSPYMKAAETAFFFDLTGANANGANGSNGGRQEPEFVYNGPERL